MGNTRSRRQETKTQASTAPRYSRLVALVTLAFPLTCFGLPDSFSAEYVLKALGMTVGRSQVRLNTAADGRYVYEKRSASAGLLSLLRNERVIARSEGHYQNGELRPVTYTFKRTSNRKNRDDQMAFDWDKKRVQGMHNGTSWEMPLPNGALDKLVYSVAIMRDLTDGKRSLEYTVADGGKLKTYYVEHLGEEQLETALGSLHTVKVRRWRSTKRDTILWCAPALSFLPVRMEHREKDGTAVAHIQAVQGFELENSTSPEY